MKDDQSPLGGELLRKRLGGELRAQRKAGGYSNPDSFVEALKDAGCYTTRSAYCRIEAGDVEPKISVLIAASIVLHGVYWREGLVRLVESAMPIPYLLSLSEDADLTVNQVKAIHGLMESGEIEATPELYDGLIKSLERAREAIHLVSGTSFSDSDKPAQ